MTVMIDALENLKRSILRCDERIGIGSDWPQDAESMLSIERMDNFRYCIETVVKENISGDVIECGVWRGGACIYAKAILDARNSQKKVFVADSFCGFPVPKFNWDKGADFLTNETLKISEEEVKENFQKYGYLDDRVIFVRGYFEDSLPKLHETFSVVRADGDLFESTIDILENLYPRLSVGGFLIVDDFGLECCRQAITQYREKYSIIEPIIRIDDFGVYWRKEK